MTKIFSAVLVMLAFVSVAEAQNSIKPILGFSQGAVNFGADFEHTLDATTGVGGYFLYSSKDSDTGKPQTISVGGFVPVHFTGDNRYFDVYLAPGFGLTMVDLPASDETVLGPSVKLGFMYKVADNMKIGLDHIHLVNWFSDKVAPNYSYTNAALSFAF